MENKEERLHRLIVPRKPPGDSPSYEIWESNEYVCQIECMGNSYKVIMFSKKKGPLYFVGLIIYEQRKYLNKLAKKIGLKPTKKTLRLV